ncbi:hypothetical protein [Chryseobacterium limigenitum]|uniref:Uncharacterized protein n=1 Tax=Chryseobacterium limigenitum TaxID=1612149 RepID=A0A1K2ILQ1_9FLAO|nr:hypothetical protein [Chryseobacterium limigenitum]SFZ93128.1 hypothetical protein SAMN05216324_104153 [Chryseobacterium limigenitum]
MDNRVRRFLIELARNKLNPTITYQKLSDACKLNLNMQDNPHDRIIIGNILGEISEYEHENKRPLLSALVIRLSDGEEGEGFYRLAERLVYGNVKKLKSDFFEYKQINLSVDYWNNETNYLKFKDI